MLVCRRLPNPSFLVSTPRHSERDPPLAFFCYDFGASEATICSNRKGKPDLVVRDKDGNVNTVRCEQINAMLLNEFLKEHKKVEEQQVTISEVKKDLEVLTVQFKEQAAQIQKVSGQLQMRQPRMSLARINP